MSQHERVATLCREHLQGLGLAHTFDASVIKSYLRKHGKQGNAWIAAINSADSMIENYKPEAAPELEQYDPFFN